MKKLMVLLSLFLLSACGTPPGELQSPDQINSRANASARVHTELAGLYYERAQLGVALSEIELALQAERNYAPAYNVRGLVNFALREYQAAEEDFKRSLSLDKNDSEAHNNYGWFLCQRGKEQESITHFMAALKNPLYTTPERAYLNAGLCSRKAGNNKDAEEFLSRALQVRPGFAPASLALAELSFEMGAYHLAKKYFASYSERTDSLTAEQLWLAVRIGRKTGDQNAEASYAMQLRTRFPDARETQLLMHGE